MVIVTIKAQLKATQTKSFHRIQGGENFETVCRLEPHNNIRATITLEGMKESNNNVLITQPSIADLTTVVLGVSSSFEGPLPRIVCSAFDLYLFINHMIIKIFIWIALSPKSIKISSKEKIN